MSIYSEVNNDIEDVEKDLKQILSSSEYQYVDGEINKAPDYKIPDIISKLVTFLSKPVSILIIIVTLGIFFILIFLLLRLIRVGNNSAGKTTGSNDNLMKSHEILSTAYRLFQSGNYKESASLIISALIRFYSENHILQYKNGLTNREYIREILTEDEKIFFSEIVFTAERIVFSEYEINPKECLEIYEKVSIRLH